MGCCCDKSAMPVVDGEGGPRTQRSGSSSGAKSHAPPEAVVFDYVYADGQRVGNSSFAGSTASRRRPAGGGARHSPSFAGAQPSDQHLVTFTPRDFDEVEVQSSSSEGSRPRQKQQLFMTNAHDEISTGLVGSFVDTLHQRDVDPLTLIMGGSSAGGSRRKSSSRLSQSEKAYIFSASGRGEQTMRLMELEELARGEIIGAMLMTTHNLYYYQDLMRGIRKAIATKKMDLIDPSL